MLVERPVGHPIGSTPYRATPTSRDVQQEGDTICIASCLLFSAPQGIRDFFNASSHGALLEGPLLEVCGLDAGEGVRSSKVYAVLVGVARLLCDFRGIRKYPNCTFRASAEAGPNDRFLKLMVQTHNGCGVAAGSEVVADFGEKYVPAGATDASPAKKFKGSLDLLLDKQKAMHSADLDLVALAGVKQVGEKREPMAGKKRRGQCCSKERLWRGRCSGPWRGHWLHRRRTPWRGR